MQLLPSDQTYQVKSYNILFLQPTLAGTFETFNSGKHSKHSINAGELQEACDERGELGEGHLHLAGQRRQERC